MMISGNGVAHPPIDSEAESAVDATTVLIVDDYLVDRRIAGAIVERSARMKPIYAESGEAALEAIREHNPAAVITDLQMPGMNGLELVEQIRDTHPRLPVILMTAFGGADVAIEALRAGAANYVPKLMLAKELARTLHRVLSLSAVIRQRYKILGSLEARESTFRLENDPSLLPSLIQMLQDDLDGMAIWSEPTMLRVGIALNEALANALYHGNLEVSSDLRQDDERKFYELADLRRRILPYSHRKIHVFARFDREQAFYKIRDEGTGFDTSSLDRPIDPEDLTRIGGRGLLLIRTFMDDVLHNPAGNEITLIKRRGARN